MKIDIDLSQFGKSQSLLEGTIKGAKNGYDLGGLVKPGLGNLIGLGIGATVGFFSSLFSNNKEK